MFRNTEAHTPKYIWSITEQDALEILGTISYCHRRLDNAQKIRMSWLTIRITPTIKIIIIHIQIRQNAEINRNWIMIFNSLNRWKSGNYYYLCIRKRRRTLKYRGVQKGAYRDSQRYKRFILNGLPPGCATPRGSRMESQLVVPFLFISVSYKFLGGLFSDFSVLLNLIVFIVFHGFVILMWYFVWYPLTI